MKKLFTIFIITLSGLTAKGQVESFFVSEFDSPERTSVGILSNYDIKSNNITSAFSNKFITGGFIDDELKNSVLDRSKNANRIGGNLNSGIFSTFGLTSDTAQNNLNLFVSIKDRAHFDMGFSKDLFRLSFYGNSDYLGKTANLNQFSINFLRYQQLQVGIYSPAKDSMASWGVGLSFIKGEEYLSLLANRAELFTSSDGQSMSLDTEILTVQSDTANKGLTAFNGYGASLDLFFEAPFDTRIGISKIKISVSDIGSIYYNNKTIVRRQDSILTYTGVDIANVSGLQDTTLESWVKDSIIEAVVPYKQDSYAVTLPAVLNLSFNTMLNEKISISEGVQYIFNANYKVLFYAKGSFYINPKLLLSTTLGYGGYGNFNCGVNISAMLAKRFILYIGSNNIEGFILPKKASGQAGYISLIKKFN